MHKDQLAKASFADRSLTEVVHPHVHAGQFAMSRRGFIGGAAGAAGAVLGAGLLAPMAGIAKTADPTPRPIPGGTTVGGQLFHFYGFGPGMEPASITDFHGFVGVADVRGKGTATYPDREPETLLFDTDMRFMKGVYVGTDGAVHRGTFGFV